LKLFKAGCDNCPVSFNPEAESRRAAIDLLEEEG